uniref:Uncharacterized protein n=1 Tax=Meloidogyne enterolobii TaxID=390850 RepID=A0A6V7WEP8_MELEN|nr:unnamed protein product [Meloidogyne enterolobii]
MNYYLIFILTPIVFIFFLLLIKRTDIAARLTDSLDSLQIATFLGAIVIVINVMKPRKGPVVL